MLDHLDNWTYKPLIGHPIGYMSNLTFHMSKSNCINWTLKMPNTVRTCDNLVKFYRTNLERKDWQNVLDNIKKDLIKTITNSNSVFSGEQKKSTINR